jgi:hypothetical protein
MGIKLLCQFCAHRTGATFRILLSDKESLGTPAYRSEAEKRTFLGGPVVEQVRPQGLTAMHVSKDKM